MCPIEPAWSAGSYFLVLDFFENGGGEEIEFFQTNSTGGEQRLINVDAELVVYRDDVTRIDAANVVVANENTITCEVDIDIDEPNTWNLVLTPQCGSQLKVEDAVLTVSCQSNFNNDLQVNFLDYAELADIWDQPCSVIDWCNGLDLDFSERIDMGDLAIFAHEWLLGVYQ